MKSKLGFTMIEMTIVLIMIGILTASLAPLLLRQHTNSMEDRDRTALTDAQTAIINYAISFGGIPNPTSGGTTSGVNTGQMTSVSAYGVNNWGAFGTSGVNPFLMDVNSGITSTYITNLAGAATNSVGGDRATFCQAVNAAMSSVSQYPQVCQDTTTDHTTVACTASVPAAFVLYSAGNDRTANQGNALGGRVYENDKRGINDFAGHYDDQVMSYPLSALARDCREKMGVAPEVMNCQAGYKYVGSLTNNYTASVTYGIGSAASAVVPANFTSYVNTCFARTDLLAVSGVIATSAVSSLDTNNDGRVDIFISATSAVTAQ